MAQAGRPLSPHLQIYRWYLTMGTSIAHRVTGSALAVGLILLTWWLVALASGPEAFAVVQGAMDNILGGLVLFGYTVILFYHCATGIRQCLLEPVAVDHLQALIPWLAVSHVERQRFKIRHHQVAPSASVIARASPISLKELGVEGR